MPAQKPQIVLSYASPDTEARAKSRRVIGGTLLGAGVMVALLGGVLFARGAWEMWDSTRRPLGAFGPGAYVLNIMEVIAEFGAVLVSLGTPCALIGLRWLRKKP